MKISELITKLAEYISYNWDHNIVDAEVWNDTMDENDLYIKDMYNGIKIILSLKRNENITN